MKHLANRLILAALLFNISLSTYALPLGFVDLGNSLVDQQSNLEWLDVNYVNNSYANIYSDITNNGGLFEISDGWRFASATELRQLMVNWFDNVDPSPWDAWEAFGIADEPKVTEFVSTFTNGLSRQAEGYINPIPDPGHIAFNGAVVNDGIGSNIPGEGYKSNDSIIFHIGNPSQAKGAWLVRSVDEPNPLSILLLISSLLCITNIYKKGDKSLSPF